eukprot:2610476-Pyramimonas_sp.AAC.1
MFSSSGECPRERRQQVESLVNIIANFPHPLSRDAINMHWSESPAKSCIRSQMKGRCNFRVRFGPSTAEPAIACRKARRHDLKKLPSSDEDRRGPPAKIRQQLPTQWR